MPFFTFKYFIAVCIPISCMLLGWSTIMEPIPIPRCALSNFLGVVFSHDSWQVKFVLCSPVHPLPAGAVSACACWASDGREYSSTLASEGWRGGAGGRQSLVEQSPPVHLWWVGSTWLTMDASVSAFRLWKQNGDLSPTQCSVCCPAYSDGLPLSAQTQAFLTEKLNFYLDTLSKSWRAWYLPPLRGSKLSIIRPMNHQSHGTKSA